MTQETTPELLKILQERIELQEKIERVNCRLKNCEDFGRFKGKTLDKVFPDAGISAFRLLIKQALELACDPMDEWHITLFLFNCKKGLIARCARLDEILYFDSLQAKADKERQERLEELFC